MSTQGLSDPGSSVYTSDTMHVGDGTWDSQRNTFLLPNLQAPNFDTMVFNGMGNRFRNMAGYKGLVIGHGVLAAITFLFVVPGAIFMARFYHRNPRTALRIHIWLQIMTVLLSTALFVLAFQAVGPERSLTNPHHGIGVALYALVVIQAFGGSLIHHFEKGKERFKIPLKLMLHQWIGRLIALLGIVQIPLGLALYGSPKVLFILFAVWSFLLAIAYFVLSYRNQPDMGFDDGTTYITERTGSTRSRRSRGGSNLGALATAGAAGAGLAALNHRSRSRGYSRSRRGDGTVLSSHRSRSRSRINESRFTDSYLSDEKYADKKGSGWKDRMVGAGAAAGGIFAFKSLFGRKNKRAPTETTMSDVSYGRPLRQSEVTQTDLSRVEEGRAPASPVRNRDDWQRVEEREAAQAAAMAGSPGRAGPHHARDGNSIDSLDSRISFQDEQSRMHKDDSYGVADGIKALGFVGFVKHTWNKRQNRREDARVEAMRRQDLEDEKLSRAGSHRRKFTGDGVPPMGNRRHSFSDSEITGVTPSVVPHNRPSQPPPPGRPYTVLSDSESEAYHSPGRYHHDERNAALAGGAAGAAMAHGSPSRRRQSQNRSSRDDSMVQGDSVLQGDSIVSPPVSVKVKMHNDGRHVTLRRLNEEEAAAEREARKRERQNRNRNGSLSSLDGQSKDRWRRTEAMEAAQAKEMAAEANGTPQQYTTPIAMPEPFVPPPPPGPPPNLSSGRGNSMSMAPPPPPMSGTSPMPPAGESMLSSPQTETDASNYDTNRRRRRAERAQAKQARMGGSRVEFS